MTPKFQATGHAAFLRVDENKEELFHYLWRQTEQLGTIAAEHGQVISIKCEAVICNGRRDDTADLSPSDTRLILHAADAAILQIEYFIKRTKTFLLSF